MDISYFVLLQYLLLILSLVAVIYFIAVLFRFNRVLMRLESIIEYVDHVREILELWEGIPKLIIKEIIGYFKKK